MVIVLFDGNFSVILQYSSRKLSTLLCSVFLESTLLPFGLGGTKAWLTDLRVCWSELASRFVSTTSISPKKILCGARQAQYLSAFFSLPL